jgi:hypothetical protein
MKICDLTSGTGQLSQSFADLKDRWVEAKEHWHDDVRRQFEQTHLAEIPTRLTQLLAAAQRLAEVLEKADKDLGDYQESEGS